MKRQFQHPAVQAHLKAAKQFPGAFQYPTSCRQIITDWEEQEDLKEQKEKIVSRQPKHLFTFPDHVIEYCYFEDDMLTYPESWGRKPKPTPKSFAEIVKVLFTSDDKPKPRSPYLAADQLEQFFHVVDKKILDIVNANPKADLKTYESSLKICIVRIDTFADPLTQAREPSAARDHETSPESQPAAPEAPGTPKKKMLL
jgi:hypothetical protein